MIFLMLPSILVLCYPFALTLPLADNYRGMQLIIAYLWLGVRARIYERVRVYARGTNSAVNSMAVLRLWNIQLTFDWNGMEPYGAYQRKSELERSKRV